MPEHALQELWYSVIICSSSHMFARVTRASDRIVHIITSPSYVTRTLSLGSMPKVKKGRANSKTAALRQHTSGSPGAGKSTGSVTETVVKLRMAYSAAANGAKAGQMKSYMRDKFEFYGLNAPERRAIDKLILSDFTTSDVASHHQLLLLLWQQEQREFQACGVDHAMKHWRVLAADEERCKASLECVQELITSKSWWDTVDLLASNVVGQFVLSFPSMMVPIMEAWIVHDNLWLRRTAILHQLKAKHKTDQDRLFRMCLQCCHEQEFFIQKAIGWALREHHKHQPQAVSRFVQDNKHRLAKLSQREALKHAAR